MRAGVDRQDAERVLEPVERQRAGEADDVPAVDQALAVNPNLFIACFLRGWISSWMGEHKAAVEQFHHAIRLNPTMAPGIPRYGKGSRSSRRALCARAAGLR